MFSRVHAALAGAEYQNTTPPTPGDEIEVRMIHGGTDGYGATSSSAQVRVIAVDADRRVVEAHLI